MINRLNNKKGITRRQFLQIIVVGGTIGIGSKYIVDAVHSEEIIRETRLLMGTVVNLSVVGVDRELAQKAISECLDQMATLENTLSQFKPNSQLSMLNRTGNIEDASDDFVKLLKYSNWMSEVSDGAFDITVKPLLDLYKREAVNQALPTGDDIHRTLRLVNYKNLEIEGNNISFCKENMSITLDGIAKGYIVDAGIKSLKSFGLSNIIVEAGGDLVGLGKKNESDHWTIGIQSPRETQSEHLTRFEIEDQAVATSGDYMQSFTNDFSQHHIIDPRTGYSTKTMASTTVLAGKAYLADALATTVMVLGSEEGIPLMETLPECEGYFINKDMEIIRTSGFSLS